MITERNDGSTKEIKEAIMNDSMYWALHQLRDGADLDRERYREAYEQAGVDNLRFNDRLTVDGFRRLVVEEAERQRTSRDLHRAP